MKLPDTSGVDLIARLRAACPFGEVVLITGFATMDAAIGALRSGAFAFVPKSFRPEELISTVEQALTKVRLAREREELERRYRALVELTDVLVVGLDAERPGGALQPQGGAVRGRRAERGAGMAVRRALDARGGPGPHARGHRARRAWGGRQEVETGFVDAESRGAGPGARLVARAARRADAPARALAPVDGARRRATRRRSSTASAST